MISNRKKKKMLFGYFLIAPCVIGAAIFYLVPLLISVVYSFSQGVGQIQFVGLKNYINLFQNEAFLLSLKNTAIFSIIGIPLVMIVALFLATLLKNGVEHLSFFRSSMLYPMIIPGASIVMVWQLFLKEEGIINGFLSRFGLDPISFLNSGWSIYMIILIFVWKNCGYNMILFLTGLAAIPTEYSEAAQIDGASKFRIFRSITLPQLRPTTFFVVLISIINSLKIFREIYQMSGGYPNNNIYFIQHFMNNNFENLNYSRICTAAVVLVLIFSAIMFLIFWFERRSSQSYGGR